jgi:hypothetical protein
MNSGKNKMRIFFLFLLESDASLEFFNKENKRVYVCIVLPTIFTGVTFFFETVASGRNPINIFI